MTRIYLLYSLLIITLITSCKAQNNNKKQNTMKTFDIETFNKNKTQTEYNFITKDSTVIEQDEDYDEYYETIKPKNSYFQTINRYYKSGKLKSTVERFPNNFLAGILKKYDQQGTLIKETDYDKPFKFTFDDILKFIKKRGIDMKAHDFILSRGKINGKLSWDITWEKEDKTGLRRAWIDGVTGKITKEFDENYPEG